jgi:hypothetical protein
MKNMCVVFAVPQYESSNFTLQRLVGPRNKIVWKREICVARHTASLNKRHQRPLYKFYVLFICSGPKMAKCLLI